VSATKQRLDSGQYTEMQGLDWLNVYGTNWQNKEKLIAMCEYDTLITTLSLFRAEYGLGMGDKAIVPSVMQRINSSSEEFRELVYAVY
jgi:hypothetical protein